MTQVIRSIVLRHFVVSSVLHRLGRFLAQRRAPGMSQTDQSRGIAVLPICVKRDRVAAR